MNVIIITACIPTLRPVFIRLRDSVQTRVSITRRSHSKLSSRENQNSYELPNVPMRIVRRANKENASCDSTYDWQNEGNSQTNIVPTNRILEVKDVDMRFEDRVQAGDSDEERGESGSRAATSANIVW